MDLKSAKIDEMTFCEGYSKCQRHQFIKKHVLGDPFKELRQDKCATFFDGQFNSEF